MPEKSDSRTPPLYEKLFVYIIVIYGVIQPNSIGIQASFLVIISSYVGIFIFRDFKNIDILICAAPPVLFIAINSLINCNDSHLPASFLIILWISATSLFARSRLFKKARLFRTVQNALSITLLVATLTLWAQRFNFDLSFVRNLLFETSFVKEGAELIADGRFEVQRMHGIFSEPSSFWDALNIFLIVTSYAQIFKSKRCFTSFPSTNLKLISFIFTTGMFLAPSPKAAVSFILILGIYEAQNKCIDQLLEIAKIKSMLISKKTMLAVVSITSILFYIIIKVIGARLTEILGILDLFIGNSDLPLPAYALIERGAGSISSLFIYVTDPSAWVSTSCPGDYEYKWMSSSYIYNVYYDTIWQVSKTAIVKGYAFALAFPSKLLPYTTILVGLPYLLLVWKQVTVTHLSMLFRKNDLWLKALSLVVIFQLFYVSWSQNGILSSLVLLQFSNIYNVISKDA